MTDRPTPEEIAEGCIVYYCQEVSESHTESEIAKAIEAERAEADRRVEKQRLAGLVAGNEAVRREVERWGKRLEEERAAVVHWLRYGSKSCDWDETIREIERGEHRK